MSRTPNHAPLRYVLPLASLLVLGGCATGGQETPPPPSMSSIDKPDPPTPDCLNVNVTTDHHRNYRFSPYFIHVDGGASYALDKINFDFGNQQQFSTGNTQDATHKYANPGTYQVAVEGILEVPDPTKLPMRGNHVSCPLTTVVVPPTDR